MPASALDRLVPLWAVFPGTIALVLLSMLHAEGLNELITIQTSRATVALQYRIPQPVWYVLLLLTTMCMGGVGYQFGIAGRGSSLLNLWLAVAFSAVVTLIAQLDRPTEGLRLVSQNPMLDLERRIGGPPE